MIVMSGGQTGADMGGLLGAERARVTTGGWAPHGWMTERGPNPDLALYGLREHPRRGYPPRTRANVQDSDATLIVGFRQSPGVALTIRCCRDLKRPFFPFLWKPWECPTPSDNAVEGVVDWLRKHEVEKLNVAGHRESTAIGIEQATADFVYRILRRLSPRPRRTLPEGTIKA